MRKVSVILTTYNSQHQIQDVLDSILNQKGVGELFDLELLVVDDCSKDKTTNILLDNNINFMVTEHNTGGPNCGRNLALSKCSGDYICIVDHDDVWFANKLQKLLSVSNMAPIVTSGYILSDSSSSQEYRRVNKSTNKQGYIEYKRNETFKSKLIKSKKGQHTYLGSILFHKSLKNILFEEDYGMIDFDWVLRLFYNQKSVEICTPLYVRNVHRDNLSLNEKYRLNDYNYSIKSILSYKNKFTKEVKLAEKRINGSMGRYYYLIGDMKKARRYFLKSSLELKIMLYLITTFVGSKFVKKYFKVFG